MLQDRQLIRLFSHIIEQTVYQSRRDLPIKQPDRTLDRLAQLPSAQARHQELASVHRFRKPSQSPRKSERMVSVT